ncbi:hypothetical protein [Xylophilus sp. Leaf220]|uniref:hypothetical protein n=1 Tax=Xylophilus sp. Leaf220 TaxID=1735686 RepID=UPI00350FAB5C
MWRSWAGGRWHVNPAWTGLAFTPDPLDQSVKTIERSGSLYQRSGTSDLYIFDGVFGDAVFIRRNGTGWRWFDRQGNWILYDARGRITAYGDANSLQVQFVIDAQGQRIAAQDALGNLLLTFTYRDDRLIAVQDRADRKILYAWVGDRLAQVTDARGGQWRYEYDARGQLTKRTDPTGASVQIAYADSVQAPPPAMDSGKNAAQGMPASGIVTTSVPVSTAAGGPGRVGKLTDEAGTATLWNTTYDRTARQYTVTTQLADGQTVVRRYDQDGRLTRQTVNGVDRIKLTREGTRIDRYTDARGLTNTIEYDGNRQPVKLTYPDGTADLFAYDTQGRPTQHTSALGTVTRLEYDAKGNLVKQTEAPGTPEERTTAWVYDAWGQPTETTTAAGGESARLQARYDTWGNLSELTDAEGAVRRYTYNAMGQVLQQTDPLGFAWTAEYDPSGNLTKATDPLGHSRSWRQDAVGRTLQATDALGQTVRYAYTPRGQTARYTDPLQQDWTYEYDPLGRWTKRSSPGGLSVQMAYDAEGRTARQTDPAGNVTQNVYGTAADGLLGLLAARVYPTYREEYRYDQRRRLTQRIAVLDPASPDPDSPANRQTTRFGYDAAGQLLSVTAADGATTLAQYDPLGRKTQAVDALGGKTRQAWNVHSQPTALTDAAGNTHRFAYDKAGRVVRETRPGGGTTLYAYDAAGQLTRRTEPAGNSARYTYDAAGRRTEAAYTAADQTSPSQTVTTTYDAADRIASIRQSADSATGAPAVQIAYLRDAAGRKTQETITYGSGAGAIAQTLRYAYDADGRQTQLTYPDGSQQRYSYDKGRLASAQLPNGQTIGWSGWRWNAPTQVAFPRATQTLAYDPLQRLRSSQVSGADGRLLDRGLTYDLAGNITQRQTEAGNFAYAYDRLGRLTEATSPSARPRPATSPTPTTAWAA